MAAPAGLRFANLFMSVLLSAAAYVQLNDPHPILWGSAYGVPALLCLWIGLALPPHVTRLAVGTVLGFVLGLAGNAFPQALQVLKTNGFIFSDLEVEDFRTTAGMAIVVSWLLLNLVLLKDGSVKRPGFDFGWLLLTIPLAMGVTWYYFSHLVLIGKAHVDTWCMGSFDAIFGK
mmetsp:Transcript_35487/g.57408  ORF Transcript_35487/g.57408 Transcript_35487/m.57408 type:complete len:174 (+) Transcript_35487:117-638(+)|eukprot:CAMPEP_0184675836 /NCGR_PEP_ID=MMETSP0308-20130426/88024_1 /TAXON_ID=38269 /ORGANISM="Gloeochaete witrockiana, Strain SAG 46.84" /LENGTH=173 /DNA_ID=CAMNT_0027123611 /DNA_START=48 /DNA_END=569 /DNA_ORIENTATION=-